MIPRRPLPPPPGTSSLPPRKAAELPPLPTYEDVPPPVSRGYPARPPPPPRYPEPDQAIYDDGEEVCQSIDPPLSPSYVSNQDIYDDGEQGLPLIPQARKPLPLYPSSSGEIEEEEEYIEPGDTYESEFDDDDEGDNEENPYEIGDFTDEGMTLQSNKIPTTPVRPLPDKRSPITPTSISQRPPAILPPTPQETNFGETYEELPTIGGEEFYEEFNEEIEPRGFPPKPSRAPQLNQERPARPLPSIETAQHDNSGSSDSSEEHIPARQKVNIQGSGPLGGLDLSQILKVKLKPTNPPPKNTKTASSGELNCISAARSRLKKASGGLNDNVVPLKPPNVLKRSPKVPNFKEDATENAAPVPKCLVSPPIHNVPASARKSPSAKPQDIPSAIVSPMRNVKLKSEFPLPDPPVNVSFERNNNNGEQDQLMVYPWFHGSISRIETERHLSGVGGDGVFLVRNSRKGNAEQPYTLTILYQNNFFTLKIRCREKDKKIALGEEKTGEMSFSSVASLISYHRDHNVILIGNPGGKTKLLSFPCSQS